MVDAEHDAADHWAAGTPRTFVGGDFLKANPNVSPDGRWVAYAAADSGRWEIYVQPFSGQGGRVQISSGGGNLAVWSPVKPELYYAASGGQQQMMVVPYRVTGDTFTPEKARAWSPASFSADPPVAAYGPHFDIHPDGSRFVVAPRATPAAQSVRGSQIVTLFNLYDGLRRIAPVAK